MKLGVVVVNWNGAEVTPRCLDSILRSLRAPDAIVVVDNASSDGSKALIRANYPQAVLIESDVNLGFAEGCNLGIRYLIDRGFDYVLLLNNDAELDPACLQELERAARRQPAAAYSATIYDRLAPTKIWYAGGSISRLTLEARHLLRRADGLGAPLPTEFVSGCAMLLERKALEQIGLLDGSFFAYYEDVDWCLRARAAGRNLLYVPNAIVRHEASHSFRRSGPSENRPSRFSWARKNPLVLYLGYRNRLLLAGKHSRGTIHLIFLMARVAAKAVLHAGLLLASGRGRHARAVLEGVCDGWKRLPASQAVERYLEPPSARAS